MNTLNNGRHGKLTALRFVGRRNGKQLWEFLCDCGQLAICHLGDVKSGRTSSCGCFHKKRASEANKKHGLSRKALYQTWCNMIQRCTNPNSTSWVNYGGRGIKVCERWKSFESFRQDMGGGFHKGLTIERCDNEGNYEKENCKWIPKSEQSLNTRRSKYIELNGETLSITAWARKLGIDLSTLIYRIKMWGVVSALTTPPRTR